MVLDFTGGNLFGKSTGKDKDFEIISIPGSDFGGSHPDVDNVTVLAGKLLFDDDFTGFIFYSKLQLPQNSTILRGIAYGNAGLSDETYAILRINLLTGDIDSLGATTVNSYLTTNEALNFIDNNLYAYVIELLGPELNDVLYGAVIEVKL